MGRQRDSPFIVHIKQGYFPIQNWDEDYSKRAKWEYLSPTRSATWNRHKQGWWETYDWGSPLTIKSQ